MGIARNNLKITLYSSILFILTFVLSSCNLFGHKFKYGQCVFSKKIAPEDGIYLDAIERAYSEKSFYVETIYNNKKYGDEYVLSELKKKGNSLLHMLWITIPIVIWMKLKNTSKFFHVLIGLKKNAKIIINN